MGIRPSLFGNLLRLSPSVIFEMEAYLVAGEMKPYAANYWDGSPLKVHGGIQLPFDKYPG